MRTVISILAALALLLAGYLVVIHLWPSGQGSIVVLSDPPGAQIWIDLAATNAITDGKVTAIPKGKHSVTVKLDTLMAEPFAQIVEIRGGKPDTIRFVLKTPRGEPVVHSTGERLASAPPSSAINTVIPIEEIPTAAELRGSGFPHATESEEQQITVEPPIEAALIPLPPVIEPVADTGPEQSSQSGTIEISSSVAEAAIFVNDRPLSERTPASISRPFGTYTIRVELEGYRVSPDQQSVRISRASGAQAVHFTLEPAAPKIQAFSVDTQPVEGRIFVDGILVGEGSVTVERDYGTYVVTFGDLDGWRKPSPIRVSLTPAKPQESVKAKYVRLFQASSEARGEDAFTDEGMRFKDTGIIFESGKPQPSSSLGAKIREVPDAGGKYGWELGMGDPNRNPTGGDYVSFSFTLPAEVPPDTPLNLRLYLYKSSKRYPFSLTGRSEIVVEVNGRKFLDGYSPRYATYAAELDRYEEWSLQRALKPGENEVVIYTGNGNTQFNYLRKIEIQ